MEIWYNYNVIGNCVDKAKLACLLAGPLLSVWLTNRRRKEALSGTDVQWEAQESRSVEWSRCHLDIDFTDSNHNPSSFDILLLAGGWREHHTKRKHVYPVQITASAGLLLLGSAHLLFIKQMAELGLGKWISIYTSNLRPRGPQTISAWCAHDYS